MAEKFKFTQLRVEKLLAPQDGRIDYFDTECPKLTCRVSSSGNKSFVLLKKSSGKSQRITLGRFPDISVFRARELAYSALENLSSGINPIEEKRKKKFKSITLLELLEKYLEQKDLKPLTQRDYRNKLNQGFSDWLNKPVGKITREMILARHRALSGGRTAKDNKMRVLRLLMRFALALKIIDESPVDSLKDIGLWSKPVRKSRIIPADQLKSWYEAVLNLGNQKAKVYILVLLYTGLRSNEALSLRWSDVNFKKNSLSIKDTKNGTDFLTFMPQQLKIYLRSLHHQSGRNEFVFPGDNKSGQMYTPRRPIKQITQQTGIEFSSHDLRRTFATIGEAALLPESIIKRLLNHTTDNNVTTGYIRTEADTMRQAIDTIAGFIQSKVAPDEQNIVTLKTANP